MTYTKNEQIIFNAIANDSMCGGIADINSLIRDTGFDARFIRGVISSLVQKDRVFVDDEMPDGIPGYWPTLKNGHGGFFWGDELDDEQYNRNIITDSEVSQ